MESNVLKKINSMPNEKFLFITTLFFYIALLITNPSNYIVVLAFVFLFLLYFLKVQSFSISLFFVYISSLVVLTGKTYPIQLLPRGTFPIEIFPDGNFVNFIITSSHFIAFIMLIYIARQLIYRQHVFKLNYIDLLLLIFYTLRVISAFLASKNPEISVPLEILPLSTLIAYFYARLVLKIDSVLWKNLSYILCALVVFEGVLGFTQFALKSPLGKVLELQINVQYFGNAVDETQFTFRPMGSFNHANTLGVWLSSVCIFLLGSGLKNRSNIIWLSFFLGLSLMVVTISRSAWLGFTSGSLFLIMHLARRSKQTLTPLIRLVAKWRHIIGPILLFLLFFFIFPRIENSLYSFQTAAGGFFYRKLQTLDAIETIRLHPILGVGTLMSVYEGIALNLYTKTASIPLAPESWYLSIAVENGLLTFFIFAFFLITSLRKIFNSNTSSIIYISIAASIISAAVAALLQPSMAFELVLLFLSLTNGDNMLLTNVGKTGKIFKN